MEGEAGRRFPEALGTRGRTRRARGLRAATSPRPPRRNGRAGRRPGVSGAGWGCGRSAHPAASARPGSARRRGPGEALARGPPPPAQPSRGAGAGRGRLPEQALPGRVRGGPGEGSGEGGLAALSPAVRRWQQVPVCPAAGTAGATGAWHQALAFQVGGLAGGVESKVQGNHSSGLGRHRSAQPHPGGFLESNFLWLHHCRSCLHILIFLARLLSPPRWGGGACSSTSGAPTSLGVGHPLSPTMLSSHDRVGGDMCLSTSLSDGPCHP